MSKLKEKLIRNSLGVIILFLAINAFGGGYYGLVGAKDIPMEWLQGSPFHDYFIPSLILIFFVGGSSLIASIAVLKRFGFDHQAAFICGAIVLIWIVVQISIIGYVSWMQPAVAFAGVLIIFLTWLLPK